VPSLVSHASSLRVWESNHIRPVHETGPSTGPPASPRPRSRSGKAGLMRAGWAPATPGGE
jgi:hypothetical protein